MYINDSEASPSRTGKGSRECVYFEVNTLKRPFFKYTMEGPGRRLTHCYLEILLTVDVVSVSNFMVIDHVFVFILPL